MNATGVVYTPGVCRGLTMPSRTLFGCTIYLPAWVFRLCSFYWEGCGRPKRGTADEGTPLFICHLHIINNHPGIRVSVRDLLPLTDMKSDEEIIKAYTKDVNKKFSSGEASELTYRTPLEVFLHDIFDGKYDVMGEKKQMTCGKPDIAIVKDKVTIAVFETKDIGKGDLDGKGKNQEQFDRYKQAINHIVFTDYVDFHFYENGELKKCICIGNQNRDKIDFEQCKIEELIAYIREYVPNSIPEIHSAKLLADLMARKTKLMCETITEVLNDNTVNDDAKGLLISTYNEIKDGLIQGIDIKGFAKIYSQTVAYGLFAARLNDTTPDDFSRAEAAELIPKTNSFLRGVFNNLAGNNIHENISWIVDDLVNMFRATNLMKMFEKEIKKDRDPLVHFYEDFLMAFDPEDKKNRGVWYTPIEIVRFIVKSVDILLRKKMDVTDGLANIEMVPNRTVEGNELVPKVQTLDPATGTGTFLAEVINLVSEEYDNGSMQWQKFVRENLLKRLYGFEIQMASYTVAHIKVDMVLRRTKYKIQDSDRFGICLTDSLRRSIGKGDSNTGYWISKEQEEANRIKAQRPIMVMIGNPPYNGESKNKGKEIDKLIATYKLEPGRDDFSIPDTKWVNNDYVKFIGLAQQFIHENNGGIIGYINANSYLESLTFRGMRYQLLREFDEIYIINLHGDTKTRETSLRGEKEENVFQIQPGVCINLFVKRQLEDGESRPDDHMAEVYYTDVYGSKKKKLALLNENDVSSLNFEKVELHKPMYFLVPIDFSHEEEFYDGFSPDELFSVGGVGMCSKRDKIAFRDTEESIRRVTDDLVTLSESEIKKKYDIKKESDDSKISNAIEHLKSFGLKDEFYKRALYRPFDSKYTYFSNKSKGFLARPVYDIMRHLVHTDDKKNLAMIIGQCGNVVGDMPWNLAFVTDTITDLNVFYRGGGYVYPLYVNTKKETTYGDSTSQEFGGDNNSIIPNLNEWTMRKIEESLGEKPSPEDLFDYIYAVLYSPWYRERFKEFLKRDFPRIPYPKDTTSFDNLVSMGKKLCKLHLMKDCGKWDARHRFPCKGEGSDTLEYRQWENGKIYFNDTQYFDNVPQEVWEFYIGGYQVADKWLKDRINKDISLNEIFQYQNILYAIEETMKLMKCIDDIICPH